MDSQKALLRIVTTGSVDDGKSTLMGRLLFETKNIFADQYDAIRRTSEKLGRDAVDLSLLLDGLAAEREQKITIDVAYRYFETPRRRFIVADCPGHEQYTRNMVTGASTAECAIVLVDARRGLVTQSRRHAFILSLLQVPHVLVVVNKMDQAGFDEAAYRRIVDDYETFAQRLEFRDLSFLPACAIDGDNVTSRSERMPWYEGPNVLQYPGVAARRRRPEPHRLPFSGAGRHPPGPRLPRLRRSDRVRHDPRRRRDCGAALRAHG